MRRRTHTQPPFKSTECHLVQIFAPFLLFAVMIFFFFPFSLCLMFYEETSSSLMLIFCVYDFNALAKSDVTSNQKLNQTVKWTPMETSASKISKYLFFSYEEFPLESHCNRRIRPFLSSQNLYACCLKREKKTTLLYLLKLFNNVPLERPSSKVIQYWQNRGKKLLDHTENEDLL